MTTPVACMDGAGCLRALLAECRVSRPARLLFAILWADLYEDGGCVGVVVSIEWLARRAGASKWTTRRLAGELAAAGHVQLLNLRGDGSWLQLAGQAHITAPVDDRSDRPVATP